MTLCPCYLSSLFSDHNAISNMYKVLHLRNLYYNNIAIIKAYKTISDSLEDCKVIAV